MRIQSKIVSRKVAGILGGWEPQGGFDPADGGSGTSGIATAPPAPGSGGGFSPNPALLPKTPYIMFPDFASVLGQQAETSSMPSTADAMREMFGSTPGYRTSEDTGVSDPPPSIPTKIPVQVGDGVIIPGKGVVTVPDASGKKDDGPGLGYLAVAGLAVAGAFVVAQAMR